MPGADRVHKVTIIPRGRALGVTQLLPEEDRLNIGESELHARLVFMLGGRAAEKLVFDEYSAGAEDDLKQATQLARRMVTHWGMSERLGPVAYRTSEEHPFLGKEIIEQREFSEHTAQVIDEEVCGDSAHGGARATELLDQYRDKLDAYGASSVRARDSRRARDRSHDRPLAEPCCDERSCAAQNARRKRAGSIARRTSQSRTFLALSPLSRRQMTVLVARGAASVGIDLFVDPNSWPSEIRPQTTQISQMKRWTASTSRSHGRLD